MITLDYQQPLLTGVKFHDVKVTLARVSETNLRDPSLEVIEISL